MPNMNFYLTSDVHYLIVLQFNLCFAHNYYVSSSNKAGLVSVNLERVCGSIFILWKRKSMNHQSPILKLINLWEYQCGGSLSYIYIHVYFIVYPVVFSLPGIRHFQSCVTSAWEQPLFGLSVTWYVTTSNALRTVNKLFQEFTKLISITI